MIRRVDKPLFFAAIADRLARSIVSGTIRSANRFSRHYRTQHERPKFADDVGTWPEPAITRETVAIVMQGPIHIDDNFTFETLKLYARNFPSCRLLLSTWSDAPAEHLSRIAALGVEIVLTEKPSMAGLFNINLQIVSASRGVKRAADIGVRWILKTRTDQRLYDPNALSFLIAAAAMYPVYGNFQQRCRIIGVGHGTLKFAPYHVTDQTIFGDSDDMVKYWSPALRTDPPPEHWPKTPPEIYTKVPVGEICRFGAPESYISSQFLLKVGRAIDWTLQDTWAAYRDHYCFVDYGTTDFFWVKSQTWTTRELTTQYDRISNRFEFGFRDWLLLMSGKLPSTEAAPYEHMCNVVFPSVVTRIADRLPVSKLPVSGETN